MFDLQRLTATVQQNCDISDARYAGDYSLCVYLLKMREYYRWEQGYSLTAALPHDALGIWLSDREQRWQEMQGRPFMPLPINGHRVDPFSSGSINDELIPKGLVYGAGYGQFAKPHFFLGELLHREERDGFEILISSCELARDMVAPPAMFQGTTIYVRRESVRRVMWERVEEWRWHRSGKAMERALAGYGPTQDDEQLLEAMTEAEIETIVLHELGEGSASRALGPEWSDMLLAIAHSRAEIVARAVRDHLADALSTLPALLDSSRDASLHFYFASLRGMRRALYPELVAAYERWTEQGDRHTLRTTVLAGQEQWLQRARTMLSIYAQHGPGCAPSLEALFQTQLT